MLLNPPWIVFAFARGGADSILRSRSSPACYAGGFIESLRNPQTIIITAAAAADRTSFGCSNDRDLTYFGEAFYRDALPNARTLREAFDTAKAAIAAREQREHITPSDPQAYFGTDMEAKLAAMYPGKP
jgi:hypothetical protein